MKDLKGINFDYCPCCGSFNNHYEVAIIILGSTIGELLEMDHHDVPELEELINDKI